MCCDWKWIRVLVAQGYTLGIQSGAGETIATSRENAGDCWSAISVCLKLISKTNKRNEPSAPPTWQRRDATPPPT